MPIDNRNVIVRDITLGRCYSGHLGDTLCLTPLPRLLRTACNIRVFISNEPCHVGVFENNPYVAGFSNSRGINLQNRIGGHGHLLERLQRRFGLQFTGEHRPEVYLTNDEKQWAITQRDRWPKDRPVCILSTQVVAEAARYQGVDWNLIGKAWMKSCTVVQPVITCSAEYQKHIAPLTQTHQQRWKPKEDVSGAIIYNNLSLRQYMSLFSVADYFCGGSSGGSHLAAAFNIPSLIVIWQSVLKKMRFPVASIGFAPEIFLYPQHCFVAAEDLRRGTANSFLLDEHITKVRSRLISKPIPSDHQSAFDNKIIAQHSPQLFQIRSNRVIRVPTHDKAL